MGKRKGKSGINKLLQIFKYRNSKRLGWLYVCASPVWAPALLSTDQRSLMATDGDCGLVALSFFLRFANILLLLRLAFMEAYSQ